MKYLIITAGLVGWVAGPATAQQIVGRTETTFSVSETVAGGDWIRIASPNGFVRVTQGTESRSGPTRSFAGARSKTSASSSAGVPGG